MTDSRLQRGAHVRYITDDGSYSPVWELLCDATERKPHELAAGLRDSGPYYELHIRHVTAGTYDDSAVGDEGLMLSRLGEIEHLGQAGNPDRGCGGNHR